MYKRQVFGYYIEVRNTHKDKVPAEWIRKQTLANAERYITQELKEYEAVSYTHLDVYKRQMYSCTISP